jgi:Tol biopolymer transport system component
MRLLFAGRVWVVALFAVALGAVVALPAAAKYPGANGAVAFTSFDPVTGNGHVVIANPDGSVEKQLPVDLASEPVWSPDGNQILLTICCTEGTDPTPAIINADGTGFNLLNVTGFPVAGGEICRAWSPDASQLLCQFGGDTDHSQDGIYTIRVSDGTVLKRLTVNPYPPTGNFGGGDIPGDFSADGSQFVFLRAKPGAGPAPDHNQSGALFVENSDGSGLHQITPYGLADSHDTPSESWSPDGKQILFGGVHGPFSGAGLYVINTDGTGLRAIPLKTGGTRSFAFNPGWSPDGSKIIFTLFTTTRPGTGVEGIYTANRDGSGVSPVDTTGNEDVADWGTHPLLTP